MTDKIFQIDIDGMMCEGCSSTVEQLLKDNSELLGIAKVQRVSSDDNNAIVEVTNAFNSEAAEQLISKAGYTFKGAKAIKSTV